MAWQTAAGTEIAIASGTPATYDAAGFGALSWNVIGEVTQIGEFGGEFNTVTHTPLDTRGVKKGKGSFNNGTISPTMALDSDDEGQEMLEEAYASDDLYNFRVTLQDGSGYYMRGAVMSFRKNVGGVDDVVMVTPNIEIDSADIIPF